MTHLAEKFQFGPESLHQLSTCHPDLVRVLRFALQLGVIDFRVVEGHRGEEAQNADFASGASKKRWPEGKHNDVPSKASDLAPSPIDWVDRERFILLAGVVLSAAALEAVPIRWGGDWDSDRHMTDETFRDLGHFELATKET